MDERIACARLRDRVVSAAEAAACIRDGMTDSDPLYCLFTSGSTGTPKGVVIRHRSVLSFIPAFTGLFGIGENDVIGNQAPFDFDVSVKDIYAALYTGAALVVIPRQLFSQPAALMDFVPAPRHVPDLGGVRAVSGQRAARAGLPHAGQCAPRAV